MHSFGRLGTSLFVIPDSYRSIQAAFILDCLLHDESHCARIFSPCDKGLLNMFMKILRANPHFA